MTCEISSWLQQVKQTWTCIPSSDISVEKIRESGTRRLFQSVIGWGKKLHFIGLSTSRPYQKCYGFVCCFFLALDLGIRSPVVFLDELPFRPLDSITSLFFLFFLRDFPISCGIDKVRHTPSEPTGIAGNI